MKKNIKTTDAWATITEDGVRWAAKVRTHTFRFGRWFVNINAMRRDHIVDVVDRPEPVVDETPRMPGKPS